jgi:hypothetical protein
MTRAFGTLRDHVFSLEIIDTHEHLPAFEKWRNAEADVLSEYLTHYFSCDLVSAGLSDEGLAAARDPKQPLAKRWKIVERFWNAAHNTGYARSLDLATKLIYGIDEINGKTLGRLNEAFVDARRRGKHYEKVLKKISRIEISIEDGLSACVTGPKDALDTRFFRGVTRADAFLCACTSAELRRLGACVGMTIHSLDDLARAVDLWVDNALKAGAVGLKCGLAYQRPLFFEKTTRHDAEREFVAILRDPIAPAKSLRRLENWMMHVLCAAADARKLPFQIHTGLQEGNGNFIANAEPSQLSNLFYEYPNVRFDLFHIGYPYQQTMSALAKNFRNVFIDFAWANIISPEASVRAMVEYLDAVPANKLLGFGGDYCFIDGVAGHAQIARENCARALAEKVDRGVFSLARAKELAQMILHDNAAAVFGLDSKK